MKCPDCRRVMTEREPMPGYAKAWECVCGILVDARPVPYQMTFMCSGCVQDKPKSEETYDGSEYCLSCDARPSPLARLHGKQGNEVEVPK